jgi:hypothetical protein
LPLIWIEVDSGIQRKSAADPFAPIPKCKTRVMKGKGGRITGTLSVVDSSILAKEKERFEMALG